MRYVESLNLALHELFNTNNKIFLIGEDILDPYGGAFKVSKGLSDKYPEKVISTPISESGIIGLATGLSLADIETKCICEIMFADFVTLSVDQIVNHLVKFKNMYRLDKDLNVTIRMPSGAYRSYGPTHSQSLESLFFNVPNLDIISPSIFSDPGITLKKTVNFQKPSIFVEHKSLYPLLIVNQHESYDINTIDCNAEYELVNILPKNHNSSTDLTIISYGHLSQKSFEAIISLQEDFEIMSQLIIPTKIFPFNNRIIDLIKSKKVFIIDETLSENGWARYTKSKLYDCDKSIEIFNYSTDFDIIPSSKILEKSFLIQVEDISQYILSQL